MGLDDPYGDFEDPYVQWARAGALPPAAATASPAPAQVGPVVDPYAAWATGPVTSPVAPGPVVAPDQALPGPPSVPQGPVTAPAEAPAVTTPSNAYGGRDVFGGDANPAERAKAIEVMTPEDRAAAVQSMTPEEFVGYKATRNRALLLKQAELEHQANTESEARARENLEMQRTAIAKADADTKDLAARADAIANTQIDPGRYAATRSTGGAIADILNMTLGGAMSRYNGGRNLGIEQFDRRVDADIAAQHADIANRWRGLEVRKGAIADEYARHGDLYRAQETYRVAAYQSAINSMQSTLQQFDPAGGTAMVVRDQIDQFRAAQGQALNAFGQQQLKNHLDVAEQDRKTRETNSVIAKNLAETNKLYVEAGKVKATDQVFTPPELAAIHPGAPVPPIGMSLKDYKTWLEAHKIGQETALGEREYGIGDVHMIRDADGNVVGSKSVPFVNSDKKPYRAPSTKEAETLRNQKAGVDTTSQFIDQMVSGIKKYGGASKYFKSPEWQTAQANKESLLFALHQAYGVEGFRPGVLEQMEKALGGQDPTAYAVLQSNAVPGLEAAKKAVVAHFNANLRSKEYTGPEYSPEAAPPPAELPKLGDRTLAESAPGPLDKVLAGAARSPVAVAGDALIHPFDTGSAAAPESGPAVGPTGLSPGDTAKVEDLVRRYKGGTPATKEKVVAALTAPLGAGRPTLNTGILGLVNGESPELYELLLQALPPEEREREKSNQDALEVFVRPQLPKVVPPKLSPWHPELEPEPVPPKPGAR